MKREKRGDKEGGGEHESKHTPRKEEERKGRQKHMTCSCTHVCASMEAQKEG